MLKHTLLRKKSKSERSKIIFELDKIVRQILLLRDKVCLYSGRTNNLQVSHYISRSNLHLRHNLDNVHLFNGGIHLFLFHKRPHIYREWLIKKIGLDKVEWLEMQDRIYCKPIYTADLKLLKQDLLSKLEYYKHKEGIGTFTYFSIKNYLDSILPLTNKIYSVN